MHPPDKGKQDLASLVCRAQKRDAAAFATLVVQFQNLALGFAFALLRDWHKAQDAAQEAFLTAYEALPELQEPQAFPGWLRTIVFRQCRRMLRRYEVDSGPIDLAQDAADGQESPVHELMKSEQREALSAAIDSLPPELRQAVVMFYLRGVSQKEMAAFLGVPVSTVNNRLHEARKALKQRLLTMTKKQISEHGLGKDFADNIGRVISVRGPVVEAKFEGAKAADVFDVLAIADESGKRVDKVKVVQRLPDGTVRGVAVAPLEGVAVGGAIANMGGVSDGMTPYKSNPAMAEDTVAAAVRTLGRPADKPLRLLETGIKTIDLFCPLPADGNVGFFGIQGEGRIVLAEELFHRFRDQAEGLRLFYLVHRDEPDSVRDMLQKEDGYQGDVVGPMQVIWLLCMLATDMDVAAKIDPFDAAIYCHPLLGIRGLWPAVDPLRSNSVLLRQNLADAAHRQTAERARGLIRRARELMADDVVMELLACRAKKQAKLRVIEHAKLRLGQLNPDDRLAVTRARKLECFLTNPFFVAESFTGIPGQRVPLAQTIRGCNMIMDGQLDAVDERKLAYIGAIDEAFRPGEPVKY